MSRWFRFYDEAVNDPKLLRLSDAMFRAWVTLLCIASKNDGKLPPIADIALMLRVKVTKIAEWLAVLTAGGLFDNNDGVFSPHNWNARQYKSDVTDPTAASRQKAYRDRNKGRDGDRNATVTVTDTRAETEQITDSEQRKKTRVNALAEPWTDDDRIRFWELFPNKVGKADALKAFDKATHKTTPDVFFPALDRYAHKTDDRPFCNPSTWLNQERWLDQPAINPNGRRTVHDAARELHEQTVAAVLAFDEPAPGGIRDGTGQSALRLLPAR